MRMELRFNTRMWERTDVLCESACALAAPFGIAQTAVSFSQGVSDDWSLNWANKFPHRIPAQLSEQVTLSFAFHYSFQPSFFTPLSLSDYLKKFFFLQNVKPLLVFAFKWNVYWDVITNLWENCKTTVKYYNDRLEPVSRLIIGSNCSSYKVTQCVGCV